MRTILTDKVVFSLTLHTFQIGEAFIHVSMDEANQLIESRKQNIEEDLKGLDSQTDELKSILADLKVKLYGKFGNNINLEEDED